MSLEMLFVQRSVIDFVRDWMKPLTEYLFFKFKKQYSWWRFWNETISSRHFLFYAGTRWKFTITCFEHGGKRRIHRVIIDFEIEFVREAFPVAGDIAIKSMMGRYLVWDRKESVSEITHIWYGSDRLAVCLAYSENHSTDYLFRDFRNENG